MNYTRHAKNRSQERGIPQGLADLIVEHGTPIPQSDGTREYRLRPEDKQEAISRLRKQIQHPEGAAGKAVLVGEGNEVITLYHLND